MLVYPSMVSGGVASKTPVYAFGESYGGSYVISLAKVYLDYRFVKYLGLIYLQNTLLKPRFKNTLSI